MLAAAALTTLTSAVLAAPTHAAPSPVDATTAAAQSATVTVPKPTGIVAGDVIVAAITARAAATASIAAPSGWTQVRRDSCLGPGGVPLTQAVYVRVASPSDPPATVWSVASATGVAAGLAAYRGVDGAAPVQSSGGDFSRNSRGIHAPPVTAGAGSLVAGFFGRSAAGAITTPGGTSPRYLAATAHASVLAVDAVRAAAGTTGELVARPSAPAACNLGQVVVLRSGSGGSGGSAPPPPPPPPTPPPPPPPPSGSRTIVLVDRAWTCSSAVDLDLVKVTMRNADDDAITLAPGCSGRIKRVEVETWTQDGIKVQNQANPAHDLVIEGGYVKGWALTPGAHQDGVQAMGGARITLRNLLVDVVGAQNLFINRAGGGATTPTSIVCESCVLGPNVSTPLLVNVSVASGARDTLVCTATRYGRSTSYSSASQNAVDTGNTVLSIGDPRCTNVTGR